MSRLRLALVALVVGAMLAAAWLLLTGGRDEVGGALEVSPASSGAAVASPGLEPEPRPARPDAERPETEVVRRVGIDESVGAAKGARWTGVRGEVVDRLGNPLEGAAVRLGRPLWTEAAASFFGLTIAPPESKIWAEWSTVTDADGRFEFVDPTPGNEHAVRVTTADRRVGQSHRFLVVAGDEIDIGRIVATPGGGMVGELVDVAGAPVGGVLVFVDGFPARSDSYGRFDLGLLPAGPAELELPRADWKLVTPPRIVVPPRRTLDRTVVVRPSFRVYGVVVDGGGDGVKGRRVAVTDAEEGENEFGEARTDLDGAFGVEVPESGLYRVTVSNDAGTEPLAWAESNVPDDGGVRFVVNDVRRLHIKGRSLEDGKPVLVTWVRTTTSESNPAGARLTPSHPDCWRGDFGSLYIRPPRGRITRVTASAIGFFPADAVLPADFDSERGELEVAFGAGATMHVLVRQGDDRPVAGALVYVTGEGEATERRTDAAGRAAFGGFPDGRFAVQAESPRGLTVRRDGILITQGSVDPVVLTYPATGSVSGRARDPEGRIAAGVGVWLRGPNGILESPIASNGTFRIEEVPSGWYELFATLGDADRYPFHRLAAIDRVEARAFMARFEVTAGDEAELSIVVPWRQPGALRIRCVDADGRPIRGVLALVPWAALEDGADAIRLEQKSEAFPLPPAGVLGFPRLAPLRYSIYVAETGARDVWHAGGEVVVESGERSEPTVRIGATYPVEGTVIDGASGQPADGALLQLHHVDGHVATELIVSEPDGKFRFAAAPAGRLRLRARLMDREADQEVVADAAGAPVVVVLP